MRTQIVSLVEELFELDPGSLTGNEPLSELPQWSSLMFVALIATIDEEFEVTLSPKDILDCADVNSFASLVDRSVSAQQAV